METKNIVNKISDQKNVGSMRTELNELKVLYNSLESAVIDYTEARDTSVKALDEIGAKLEEAKARATCIFSICLIFFVLLLFSLLISFYIIKGIKKLTKAAFEYKKGNFNYKGNVSSPKELAQLCRSMENMATELARLEQVRKDFVSNKEAKTLSFSLKLL